jgi:hypothetical protein
MYDLISNGCYRIHLAEKPFSHEDTSRFSATVYFQRDSSSTNSLGYKFCLLPDSQRWVVLFDGSKQTALFYPDSSYVITDANRIAKGSFVYHSLFKPLILFGYLRTQLGEDSSRVTLLDSLEFVIVQKYHDKVSMTDTISKYSLLIVHKKSYSPSYYRFVIYDNIFQQYSEMRFENVVLNKSDMKHFFNDIESLAVTSYSEVVHRISLLRSLQNSDRNKCKPLFMKRD